MKIRFTKGSQAVDFAIRPPGAHGDPKPVAKPLNGITKDSCICVESGNPRVNIGTSNPDDHTTLIETNNAELGWYDVSYVEGYTLPVVCWATHEGTKTMSGYNKDLFENGEQCDGMSTIEQSSGETVKLCPNPGYAKCAKNENSCWRCTNPSRFFAEAAGAAYTYPLDDESCASNPEASGKYRSPMANGKDIQCCVGTQCPENTFSTGGMSSWGNCNGRTHGSQAICKPCGPNEASPEDVNHEPICSVPCGNKKRDLEGIFAEVAEKRKLRKRHARHQHHAAHRSY